MTSHKNQGVTISTNQFMVLMFATMFSMMAMVFLMTSMLTNSSNIVGAQQSNNAEVTPAVVSQVGCQ